MGDKVDTQKMLKYKIKDAEDTFTESDAIIYALGKLKNFNFMHSITKKIN